MKLPPAPTFTNLGIDVRLVKEAQNKEQAGRSEYEKKSIRLLWGSRIGPDYRTHYRHELRPAEPAANRFTLFKSGGTAGTNGYGHGVGGFRGTEAGADWTTSPWDGAAGRRWRGR